MREDFTHAIASIKAPAQTDKTMPDGLLEEVEHNLGGTEATEQIFAIQQKKAAVMEQLQATLAQIDQEGTVGIEGKMRSVSFDGEALQVYQKGVKRTVSKGQLLAAGMWEESYFLDDTVPRAFQKQYAAALARHQIADLYDHQIALSEANKSYNKNTGLDDAYAAVAAQHEAGAELEDGSIAEKMVQSFLDKLTHDYDMPYTLKSATAYEDVEYKIDFIIEPKSGAAAVGVKTEIGIQFTTAKNKLTIEHKKKQVGRIKGMIDRDEDIPVHDLVLVELPIDHVRAVYDEWKNTSPSKRTPGGPDELWDTKTQGKVFVGILKNILSKEEIIKAWEQM